LERNLPLSGAIGSQARTGTRRCKCNHPILAQSSVNLVQEHRRGCRSFIVFQFPVPDGPFMNTDSLRELLLRQGSESAGGAQLPARDNVRHQNSLYKSAILPVNGNGELA
jgi:hypothetical protein